MAESAIAFYHPQNQHAEWLKDALKNLQKNEAIAYQLIDSRAQLLASFQAKMPIIGQCAAAILIRQLAPLLVNKWDEPPVLQINGAPKDGHIICLLGGHHGGNHLAQKFAKLWQMQAITTSATDKIGFSPDNPPENWRLRNGGQSKNLSVKLLKGEVIYIFANPDNLLEEWQKQMGAFSNDVAIKITDNPNDADMIISPFLHYQGSDMNSGKLQICPPMLALGVGAIRDCDFHRLEQLIFSKLNEANLAPESIYGLASATVKMNESALHQIAQKYGWQLRFFEAETLSKIDIPNPSEIVRTEIGTPSVAEASAFCLADINGKAELLLEKQKNTDATCAVAWNYQCFTDCDTGIKAGYLTVLGLGPGDNDFRLPAATAKLACAETIIGYGLYLDFIRDEFPHANYVALPLGAEAERAKTALEYAMNGHETVLVASGDPGIYALATLAFEEAAKLEAPPMIEIIPGLTAMQMLAARAGAPMGHDFCAISLSDLLTPIEAIRKRVEAAAQGDFVISFYNPQSKTRRSLLNEAIEILRAHRPKNTPVIVGRQLARADEHITITPLGEFDCEQVDMFCLVMIGSSETKMFGKNHCFTPRGYHGKTNKGDMR